MRKCVPFLSFFLLFLMIDSYAQILTDQDKTNMAAGKKTWWKEAVVYQLYPRSFKDSDGDGVGDLKGIISKLDYLQSLGIDAVWLNPIFSSPNDDNGYDISDYRNIMKEFGTMEDFDELLKGLHKRKIRLVLDMVLNHSSDEHEWFKQAKSSRTNPYRNYYHWWPAEKGKPVPRYSFFDVNSDAWKYDAGTSAYYLHYFSQKQPDLNWENEKLRNEIYDMMKFWLDKGIDGLRMDAFQYVSKDTSWKAYPPGYEKDIIKYYGMGPNLHRYLKEMNKQVISKYNVMTVAEGAGSTLEDAHALVDEDRKELNMAYHFEIMDIGNDPSGYKLVDLKRAFTKWDQSFETKGWLAIFLVNHDVPRMVTKYGNDSPELRSASSKLLTTLIMTMRGTPFYYNGDELGMSNIKFQQIEDYRDIATINGYKNAQTKGEDLQAFLKKQQFISRDNTRTPFQWDGSENAGFTTGKPWIKVNPNYLQVNAAAQEQDPNSELSYFKNIVALRKANSVLVYGNYQVFDIENPDVYCYTRQLENDKMLVLLNFSKEKVSYQIDSKLILENAKILTNNYADAKLKSNKIELMPCQAIVYKINQH
ncbi:glycoside hydrolase family 13 protein [Pedobacter sandarakinus]|uniref:glycoside hydrolase family 13 protein n=1 Tax=Pedobacter sandarakinus TaxID=353156 RepID=UPI0022459011|nr:alpha-glucosidase [Pedobacter sandarakinus]MCX2575113.1 alpha-glucosidase [Pedobacter sandarakinus]